MNSPSNAVPQPFETAAAPAAASASRPFYWSLRREFWENRFLYIAPLAVAAVFLAGFVISLRRLPQQVRAASLLDPMRYQEAIATHYDIAASVLMLTSILVSVFYCIDALYGERRDRSILFWKSMPVSDLTTVLAKASIPLMIVPLVAFAVSITLQWIMLLLSSAVLLGSGLSVGRYWTELSIPRMWTLLLYHFITAHAIWPMPIYAWLLLVSGWARRAVLLWAALPVLAIAGVEAILFRSSHFAALVGSRLIGAAPAMAHTADNVFPTSPMTHITAGEFLASPGLWLGLLVTAVFLAAAVRLRRYRGPV